MIQWVVDGARSAATVDDVVVATDDERIAAAAREFADVVLTGECASGTDRVAEAVRGRPDASLVVNVQGDEPLLSGRNIDVAVRELLDRRDVPMATLCRPLDPARGEDPNAVKVVRSETGRALYFSRARVPFPRRADEAERLLRLHLGLYAFRRDALLQFVSWPPSALERAEGLEQLRALEHDMDILVLDAPDEAVGVDTPEDLARVEEILRRTGSTRRT